MNDSGQWRRGWDSNPRWACTHGGFQDRCLKPLGHLSDWRQHIVRGAELCKARDEPSWPGRGFTDYLGSDEDRKVAGVSSWVWIGVSAIALGSASAPMPQPEPVRLA